MKRILVVLAALMFSVGAGAEEAVTIGPEQVLDRLKKEDPNLIVLDVRTPEEYAKGHVPHALNIPHDQLQSRIQEIGDARGKEIVVYCRSGRRAASALEVLQKHGYSNLRHLEGDIAKWEEKKLPMAQE